MFCFLIIIVNYLMQIIGDLPKLRVGRKWNCDLWSRPSVQKSPRATVKAPSSLSTPQLSRLAPGPAHKGQVTQTGPSELTDAELLQQLFHRFGGIPLGRPGHPQKQQEPSLCPDWSAGFPRRPEASKREEPNRVGVHLP